MSTLCPHCGAHHGFGAAQLEGHGTMKSDPNIQRIADLERQLAEKQAEIDRFKERLEIGFGFDMDGNRVKIEGDHPDAIDCRNETIKLLEAEIEAMRRLAYQAGYARGHDDTVEGAYNGACEQENDCADDWYRDYESRKQP